MVLHSSLHWPWEPCREKLKSISYCTNIAPSVLPVDVDDASCSLSLPVLMTVSDPSPCPNTRPESVTTTAWLPSAPLARLQVDSFPYVTPTERWTWPSLTVLNVGALGSLREEKLCPHQPPRAWTTGLITGRQPVDGETGSDWRCGSWSLHRQESTYTLSR